MSSAFPQGLYHTVGKKLTNTSETTCYTVGQTGDPATVQAMVTGILVTASAGSAGTATIKVVLPDAVEYTLIYQGVVEAAYPLQIVGYPCIVVPKDGTIKVTGAADQHVFITYLALGRGDVGAR